MPLAVLVAGDLVSGRRPQPPAPSVTLNPIRTRWMEHLGRRPPCLRIMPFRTSCGRPDPAAGAVCGGHDRVCPALSAGRRCRKHNWPTTPIPTRRARQTGHTLGGVLAHWIDSLRIKRVRLVAASRIPTRSLVHLRKHPPCPRTTRLRTSCDAHDQGQGVIGRQTVGSAGCSR